MFAGFRKWLIDKLMYEPPSKGMPLCDFDRIKYELRPCDVILIEGKSKVSDIIKTITQSTWSHAALYIGRIHDLENPLLRERVVRFHDGDLHSQLLIEGMLGMGTIVSPLESYKDAHIRICRPAGISRRDTERVIEFAIGRLGMEYGIRQNLDIARLLLPWGILPRRWRSSLFEKNASTPTKEICSSMIAEAFGSINFPILPIVKHDENKRMQIYHRNPRLFTPRDFDYSPYFEIIKYPFIAISEHGIYRRLPWQDEMASEHDVDTSDKHKQQED